MDSVSSSLSLFLLLNFSLTSQIDVHVGYGKDGFHPYVLTNLFALIWTFEDRLELLHPETRRSGANKFCRSLNSDSKLGRAVSDTPNPKKVDLELLLDLRSNNTTFEIIDLMRSNGGAVDERLAYNLKPLVEPLDVDGKNTVKFRGHEGTMSSERVVNWINVCGGLVEFADTVDPEDLDKFLRTYIDDKDFTVFDLLRAIGRPAEAEFYEKRAQELLKAEAPNLQ